MKRPGVFSAFVLSICTLVIATYPALAQTCTTQNTPCNATAGQTVTILPGSTITVSGPPSVNSDGVGATITGSSVTVYQSGAGNGVVAANSGTVSLTDSTINVSGSVAHGLGPGSGGGSIIMHGGAVNVTGFNGYGVWAVPDSSVTLDGTQITTGDTFGVGVFADTNATVTAQNGFSITTSLDTAYGAWVRGGTITLSDGTVSTGGSGSYGLYVSAAGSSINTTNVNVSTKGTGSHGALAQAGTITLNGGLITTSGSAAHGLYSTGAGAAITAFGVDVAVSGAGAAGIFIENTGAMTVSNSQVSSAQSNALFSTVGAGLTNTTQISRSVLSSGSDTAMVFTGGGTHNISLQLAQVTGGNGTLLSVDAAPNQLVLNADASVLNGDMVNSGTADVTLSDGTIWTGASLGVTDLTVDGSTWNVTGDSTITGTLTNGGSIAFAAAGPFKSITVPNYVGNGGTMGFNTQLGADASPSDQLIIDGGSATGSTGVTVANKGGAGAQTTGNGIALIVAQGGATTGGAFALAAPVAAGPFQYLLFQGTEAGGGAPDDENTWFLRSHFAGTDIPFYRPEGSIYGSLPGLARTLGVTTIGTFHERYGDQGAVRGGAGRAWGRVFGEHSEQGSSGELDTRFDGWLGGVQLGIDAFRIRGDDGAQDAGGLFFALARADGDVNGHTLGVPNAYAGSSALNGPSFGAYYTHIGPNNWYVDSVAMVTFYNADGTSTNNVETNSGGSGAFLSLEGGVPIVLGYGATLEGQGQLIYQHLDFGGTTDPFSTVGFDTPDALTGRLGLRLAGFDGGAYRPYLKANIWQDWSGTDRTIYASTHVLSSKDNSTALEVGGGVVGDVTQTVSWWGVVDYTTEVAGNDLEVIRGNLGVKVGW